MIGGLQLVGVQGSPVETFDQLFVLKVKDLLIIDVSLLENL